MADWDSRQYTKFERQRTRPAIDLLNAVELSSPETVLDIGCGPGNSTELLRARWPKARIMGIDTSPDMLKSARARLGEGVELVLCDAGSGLANLNRKFDVVFSNACIQWIPNHISLLPSIMGAVAPGGVMAIQAPINYGEPIHLIMDETAFSPRWKRYFPVSPRTVHMLTAPEYFDILSGISDDFTMWQTTYMQRMESPAAILEWVKGTGLRPYLDALSAEEKPEFERDILIGIEKAYSVRKGGGVLFPFPRIFMTARASAVM